MQGWLIFFGWAHDENSNVHGQSFLARTCTCHFLSSPAPGEEEPISQRLPWAVPASSLVYMQLVPGSVCTRRRILGFPVSSQHSFTQFIGLLLRCCWPPPSHHLGRLTKEFGARLCCIGFSVFTSRLPRRSGRDRSCRFRGGG